MFLEKFYYFKLKELTLGPGFFSLALLHFPVERSVMNNNSVVLLFLNKSNYFFSMQEMESNYRYHSLIFL